MTNIEILKRLYKDYTKNYINKILLDVLFSNLVASRTSATAWLLDPAIDKIFLNKDQKLLSNQICTFCLQKSYFL